MTSSLRTDCGNSMSTPQSFGLRVSEESEGLDVVLHGEHFE